VQQNSSAVACEALPCAWQHLATQFTAKTPLPFTSGTHGVHSAAVASIRTVAHFLREVISSSLTVALQLNMCVQVGPGASPDTDVGPVISPAALQRMHQQIGTAVEERARLVLDGRHLSVPGYEHGAHVSIFGKHAWNAAL
jgi:Aldehyde dehydrogenase family